MPGSRESQLELFDVKQPSAPRAPHRELLGQLRLQLRYDQLVVGGIASLIAVTIIFACGVERGKQLARAEHSTTAHQESVSAQPSITRGPSAISEPAPAAPASEAGGPRAPVAPLAPKVKPPSQPPAGRSRYAVQLATYSRPQLAKQELERLKARGEPAFLVMRGGWTSVYVGPFPSKQHAGKKLARLKAQYQDCFVKNLSLNRDS